MSPAGYLPLLRYRVEFELGATWRIVCGELDEYSEQAAIEKAISLLREKHPQFADFPIGRVKAYRVDS